jgi:mediator of RNA polymerase II transcription subunit 18, fungi type
LPSLWNLWKLLLTVDSSFVSEYLLEGHRFVHKNVVLLLHRIRRLPPPTSAAPSSSLPAFDDLKLLDESGSYVLYAYVRVQDAGKPDVMNKAIGELEKLKGLLKGVVPMSAMNGTMDDKKPERLSMDTRVK